MTAARKDFAAYITELDALIESGQASRDACTVLDDRAFHCQNNTV